LQKADIDVRDNVKNVRNRGARYMEDKKRKLALENKNLTLYSDEMIIGLLIT
jgi:hypothetical protein